MYLEPPWCKVEEQWFHLRGPSASTDQRRGPQCLFCPAEHPPTPAPWLVSRGPASRHTCSQLITKSSITGGLTSRQHAYGGVIPHLGSGHQQAARKASQLANKAKALTVLQRMLCIPLPKERNKLSPPLLCVQLHPNPPRMLGMAAQPSLPCCQVTWLPLQG